MWSFIIYTSVLLFFRYSYAAPFALELELIPEDECTNVKCPQLNCSDTVLTEGSCCKSCVTPEQGCLKDGTIYDEQSIVPSNATDPCEVCHCCGGKISCGNVSESCPQLKCNKDQQVKDAGQCCPRCLYENISVLTQPQVTCSDNGIIYQEGDTWNPYFSKFGVVKCQRCTCKNGTIKCKAIPCPPVRACTSEDPVEELNTCCPKCNRSLSMEQDVTNGSSIYAMPTLVPDKPKESNITCPMNYSYKVYKSLKKRFDQIAIEDVKYFFVYVYVWSADFESVKYEPYNSHDFKKLINTRFFYIGDTTTESVQIIRDWFLVDKKRNSLFYCKRHCSARVIRQLQPCNKISGPYLKL